MVIAVNTRFLIRDNMEGYGYFIQETFRRITRDHPEHQFIFIFDRPYDPSFIFSENIKAVVTGPPARHPLLWRFWYNFKIPLLIKKYKADIFVSPDGFCSLATKIPQCLVIHDLAFLHDSSFLDSSRRRFYEKFTGAFLKKAKTIATVSVYSKNDIVEQYHIPDDKVNIVYSAAKEIFHPLKEELKDQVKSKWTAGKEYFLYAGSIHPRKNLMALLKAFSIFKKRQHSGMKLVLAGRLAWKYNSFLSALKSYKYREDVVLTGYVEEEELVKLVGAAYALVYPSLQEGFGVPVLEAMQSAVPVITSEGSAMQEIAGDAALYADVHDHAAIAEQMMLIYKDESLRHQLAGKGLLRAKEFSWEMTAKLLWQTIEKTFID
jgi:glycosyltransferase involved in cell wall biosynthesis